MIKYNSRFPGKGTVDPECWDVVGEHVKRAHQSWASLFLFFSTWGLVRQVLEHLWEHKGKPMCSVPPQIDPFLDESLNKSLAVEATLTPLQSALKSASLEDQTFLACTITTAPDP